jgi:hypothetical protein
MIAPGLLLKRAAPFVIAVGIWFAPIPAGLTAQAWHLFAVFVAAIASVLLNAYPLLTAAMMAVGTVVLSGTITPAQAFSGFANTSVRRFPAIPQAAACSTRSCFPSPRAQAPILKTRKDGGLAAI